eukprot:3186751-Prymnesium_polylepis.1
MACARVQRTVRGSAPRGSESALRAMTGWPGASDALEPFSMTPTWRDEMSRGEGATGPSLGPSLLCVV